MLNKNVNFKKTRRNRHGKIPETGLETQTLCFSLYKNWELKVKLWWVGELAKEKRVHFLYSLFCPKNYFLTCVLSQCIVYWIDFQNIHTFTYQKTLLRKLLLLVFKIVESLQCILNLAIVYECTVFQLCSKAEQIS